jgi:transposase
LARTATTIGEDAYTLLASVDQAATQQEWAWLKGLPAVRILEQTWAQQDRQVDGHAHRLTPQERLPVSEWYRSPYDEDVRYGRKRDFDWIGYKVHRTECCDDDLPHLITQVETVPATQQDHHALKAIQAELADKDLLPQQHLVDAGYVSAKRILESRDTHAIELIGPVHGDPSWQAHTPGAFDVSRFPIDWDHQVVTCPQGEHSSAWHHGKDAKGEARRGEARRGEARRGEARRSSKSGLLS